MAATVPNIIYFPDGIWNLSCKIIIAYVDSIFFVVGRSFDARATLDITQKWIEDHMQRMYELDVWVIFFLSTHYHLFFIFREDRFTRTKDATIFCGTWNVNAKKQEGSLDEWLLPPNSPIADLYAIGFQEIVRILNFNFSSSTNYANIYIRLIWTRSMLP